MATIKVLAILALLYGAVKGDWAWIIGAMVLWEVGGGFFLSTIFHFANKSSHHEKGGNNDDHGS